MKIYTKPNDTPNKCLRKILQYIEVIPELKYLEIARDPNRYNRYCIHNKYVGGELSDYMVPERLLVWFEAYLQGVKHMAYFYQNQDYELKLIGKYANTNPSSVL